MTTENSQSSSPQIIPLSEGSFTIDKTKLFVPFDEATDVLNERPVGSLLVEIQPFLIVTKNDLLLLDAGLGFTNAAGQLQIHQNIIAAGYQPADVTKVLISHLHKDHAGGLTHNNQLTFPNATYYLQKTELDFALQTGYPSFIPEEIEPLLQSNQLHFLQQPEGVIDGYIHYQVTGAHSPQHQVFWIREEGEIIFFGGDVAPQLQQMKMRYKTKYDVDPDKAMAYRKAWWQQGQTEGWTFLFYHDIKQPIFKAQAPIG